MNIDFLFKNCICFDYLCKFASQIEPIQKLVTAIKNLRMVPPTEVEDKLFDIIDAWIDQRKYLDKVRTNINSCLKSAKSISDSSVLIEKNKKEISSYVDGIDEINNAINTLSKTINIGLLYELSSIVRDLTNYKEYLEVGIPSAIQKVMHTHHYGGKMYIRFGRYHKSERSRIGLDSEWINEMHGKRYEDGVSVYNTYPMGNKWVLIQPNREKAMYASSFSPEVFSQQIAAGEIYLVTGEELKETGVDGEPLLHNLFPVRRLDSSEILLGHDKNSPTLEQWLSNYKHHQYFSPFAAHSKKEDRQLAFGLILLIEAVEDIDITEKIGLSDEQVDEIIKMYEFTDESKNLSNLSEEQKLHLKNYIILYNKYRLRQQARKGYRPLY